MDAPGLLDDWTGNCQENWQLIPLPKTGKGKVVSSAHADSQGNTDD